MLRTYPSSGGAIEGHRADGRIRVQSGLVYLLIVIGTPTPETSVTVIWNAWYRPVSSNGAENRVKASSLLNRFSILLKNKGYMDERHLDPPVCYGHRAAAFAPKAPSQASWRSARNLLCKPLY